MIKKIFDNCFLLLVPIFLWNLTFYKQLPQAYTESTIWNNVPSSLLYAENILRVIIFGLPIIMLSSDHSKRRRLGYGIYAVGFLFYFTSWILLMQFPEGNWANSLIGFTAPAFTTVIWLIGIAIVGQRSYFKIRFLSGIYFAFSMVFVIVHTLHAYWVYQGLQFNV